MKGQTFLIPNQRRLRHVQYIVGRNLVNPNGSTPLPNLGFEIVVHGVVVYVSETAPATLNPTWLPIELPEDRKEAFQDVSVFVVRVYARSEASSNKYFERFRHHAGPGTAGTRQLYINESSVFSNEASIIALHNMDSIFLEAEINLRKMQPLNVDLSSLRLIPANTLLFELSDGAYSTVPVYAKLRACGVIPIRQAVPPPAPEECRSFDFAECLKNVERILQRKLQVKEIKQETFQCEDKLEKILDQQSCYSTTAERNACINRLLELRKIYKHHQRLLAREKELARLEARELQRISAVQESLKRMGTVPVVDESRVVVKHKQRIEIDQFRVVARTQQLMLLYELKSIYPISEEKGVYSIAGIPLSYGELIWYRDDDIVAASLGYVCHVAFMLSKYLQIPLRYPLGHNGSRSVVFEHVNGQLVEYPLYRKGTERDKFELGVRLLSKDVKQILRVRGVRTSTQIENRQPLLPFLSLLFNYECGRFQLSSQASAHL